MIGWINRTELRRLVFEYPRTATAVVFVNLVPLLGVLVGGWSVGLVLVFYWFETGIVLAFSLVAGLIAAEPADTSDDDLILHGLVESDARMRLRPEGPALHVRNVPVVLSIGVALGFFWVGHGIFVWFFAVPLAGGGGFALDYWVWLALGGVVVGQASEFYSEQFVDGQYRHTDAKALTTSVIVRTVILHVTLVLGGVFVVFAAIVFPQSGAFLLAVLVTLKVPYDFAIRVDERDRDEANE